MARTLSIEDLDLIARGATLMGAGGGGSMRHGETLIRTLASVEGASVNLVSCDEMGDDEWAATVAMIGSPKVLDDLVDLPEAAVAFRLLQSAHAAAGHDIKYAMAGELGGFNTIVPLIVAAMEGIPAVDADGNGRAVPELATGLHPIAGIYEDPLALAGRNGDSLLVRLGDEKDHHGAENIARHVCMAYGMRAAFATWAVDRATIENALAPGTISTCHTVGKIMTEAPSIDELVAALAEAIQARELFRGTVSSLDGRTEGGFDFATTTITGEGPFAGRIVHVDAKNENILLRDDEQGPIVTVPDLMTFVEADTLEPLTNADIAVGQRVSLLGIPAAKSWLSKPEGYTCWSHILTAMGYDGPRLPLPGANGGAS
jgi:uncharacterized protein